MNKGLLILGLETSCDETAISLFNNTKGILSEYIFTQKCHTHYGGTIPELASRDHLKKIFNIILFVLKNINININTINVIAYTKGPGLKGPLLIGASVAKALGCFLKIPVIGVNHLEAHILLNFIYHKNIKFPALIILVSGAHTILLQMINYDKFILFGETLDDGVGEAFDKIARLLNLNPANGASLEKKLPYKFNYINLNLSKSLQKSNCYDFSFSGLKTEIYRKKNHKTNISNLLYNFQNTIIDMINYKCKKILHYYNITSIILAGGVSANQSLRLSLLNLTDAFNIMLYVLPNRYCTDNGSMIAFLGFIKINDGLFDKLLSIDVISNLRIKS